MKVNVQSEQPIDDASVTAATGKAFSEWFAELDAFDALGKGRRETGQHLLKLGVAPWWCTTLAVEYEAHKNVRKKDGLLEGYFSCSTKTIAAPVQAVFGLMTEGKALEKWFGPGVSGSLEEGATVTTSDGDKLTVGRFRVDKDIRLNQEFPGCTAPVQVEIQVQDKGSGKSGVLVNQTRVQTRAESDGLRAAWNEALDRLKKLCESTP